MTRGLCWSGSWFACLDLYRICEVKGSLWYLDLALVSEEGIRSIRLRIWNQFRTLASPGVHKLMLVRILESHHKVLPLRLDFRIGRDLFQLTLRNCCFRFALLNWWNWTNTLTMFLAKLANIYAITCPTIITRAFCSESSATWRIIFKTSATYKASAHYICILAPDWNSVIKHKVLSFLK